MLAGLQSHPWAYPALEAAHLTSIGLLLGNLALLELRVFGFGAAIPVRDLARLSLTLALIGFAVAALTGLAMFATRPAELLVNRAFTFKMGLLLLAGCNAAWFHARGSLQRLDCMARAMMLLSTVIWLAVVLCGRWIAYR